jgi:hypothetical protein
MEYLVSGATSINEPRAIVNVFDVDKKVIEFEKILKNGKRIFGIY